MDLKNMSIDEKFKLLADKFRVRHDLHWYLANRCKLILTIFVVIQLYYSEFLFASITELSKLFLDLNFRKEEIVFDRNRHSISTHSKICRVFRKKYS